MSHQFYKFEPGCCTCALGDPATGTRLTVRKLSALEAMLEPSPALRENQSIQAVVSFIDGPTLSLSGAVVSSSAQGVLVEWAHATPRDSDTVDRILQGYVLEREPRPRAGKPKGAREPEKIEVGPPTRAPRRVARAAGGERPEAQVDVAATIRSKARTVKAADLASRLDTVKVLDIQAIKCLVKEAVDESVALLSATFHEEERKRLFEEAEAAFKERLEVYKAEKQDLEEKARVLQSQLEKTHDLLEEERKRVLASSQFTVSDAGMLLLEQRLSRILDHALRAGRPDEHVEEEMRGMVQRLLDDEREKIREQAQRAQSDKIALLERKVQRLAESLESANKELGETQRRAQALESAGAIPLANVIRSDLDKDPAKCRKLTLLKEIFEFNKSLRAELKAAGRLPSARRAAPAPPETSRAAAPPARDEARIAAELGIKKAVPGAEGGGEVRPDDVPREPEDDGLPSGEEAPIESLQSQSE